MQLLSITRKSAAIALLLLVAIVVAATVRYHFAPYDVEMTSDTTHSAWYLCLAVLMFFCTGSIQGRILSRAGLNFGHSSQPIPIYGALACGIFMAPEPLAVATAAFCFAEAINLMLKSLHNADEKDSLFFASMLLGVSVLCYAPCIVLFAIIPIAILNLSLSFRQMVVMVAGYLLPLFAASYIYWYGGGEFAEFWTNLFSQLSLSQEVAFRQIPYLALAMVVVVVVLLLGGGLYSTMRSSRITLSMRNRRALYFLLLVLMVALTMLLIPSTDVSMLAIVAVPTTLLLGFVLGVLPDNLSTIAYWVVLALFVTHLFVA